METNKIYNEDCLVTMSRMPSDSVDLVVTSPPYNKGWYATKNKKPSSVWSSLDGRKIAYDAYTDEKEPREYEAWQRKVLSELLRVLKPSGSIFYNHKDIIYNGLIVPPKWVYDYPVRQQIVWNRKSSCQIGVRYFMPAHEWIYWIVKDPKLTYFDKEKAIFRTNIWCMNAEKNPHPAPFPQLFSDNCVASCCPQGGIVYDPFIGSGTTALSALKVGGINYIGSEISEAYCEMANEKIRNYQSQLTLFD